VGGGRGEECAGREGRMDRGRMHGSMDARESLEGDQRGGPMVRVRGGANRAIAEAKQSEPLSRTCAGRVL
jgi:hypothetical protein